MSEQCLSLFSPGLPQVPILAQSSLSRGLKGKMMASMKNSFRSLRIKRNPSELRPKRSGSDTSSSRQRSNYPGVCVSSVIETHAARTHMHIK